MKLRKTKKDKRKDKFAKFGKNTQKHIRISMNIIEKQEKKRQNIEKNNKKKNIKRQVK